VQTQKRRKLEINHFPRGDIFLAQNYLKEGDKKFKTWVFLHKLNTNKYIFLIYFPFLYRNESIALKVFVFASANGVKISHLSKINLPNNTRNKRAKYIPLIDNSFELLMLEGNYNKSSFCKTFDKFQTN